MAAEDHLNSQQFFHGTNVEFKPGDVLQGPGYEGAMTFNPPHDLYSPHHVYFSSSISSAEGFAHSAVQRRKSGKPRVYEVEPNDEVESDPETEGIKGWDVGYRAPTARVKQEVTRDGG